MFQVGWIAVLISMTHGGDAARILGIFPTPAYSHQQPFQAVMKALAARGHQVTVISPNPLKKPFPNYTDIDVSFSYNNLRSSFDFAKMDQASGYDFMADYIPAMAKMTDDQLSSPQVQQLIKSSNKVKYDLVFHETFTYQSYYGLIHHLGSPPVIGIVSFGYIAAGADTIGIGSNPSYVPDNYSNLSDHMTFFERVLNTIFWVLHRYQAYNHLFTQQEMVMRKHFGDAPPSVAEAQNNISLLMITTNWLFGYPAPIAPSIITIPGTHLKPTPDPLPKDLQKFLDEATDGAIYFNFGSNVFSTNVPEEKRRIFLDAFSELPQRVLWKWESDTLPGQPTNVRIGKWMPQQDILAHPNVRLFITQCGLQSFQEAVYHGVPMIGIPFYCDQQYNARRIHEAGIGLQMLLKDITKQSLLKAIHEILHNTSFRDKAKQFSVLSRDLPEAPIEKVVWWTEYVLRHKGAKHLRSAVLDLEWYQYLLLDVIAVAIILALTAITILYYICKFIFSYFAGRSKLKTKHE